MKPKLRLGDNVNKSLSADVVSEVELPMCTSTNEKNSSGKTLAKPRRKESLYGTEGKTP